ncbi:homoprotocatechuate degradation operon regulator HpaR [Thaumasiovibrio sp. DFM-14]|uniref:homoprotocatechuate degradation operon regulator HpaR n=1 Tax=Thaumasiovibrio sp. DFM-14 TaxID=3384792 RepID=UPI0039A1CA32
MRKFDDSLPLKLLKTRDSMMAYFRPILTQNDLTDQQWRILRALFEFKELEPSQLALHCNILAPSMTGMLNRLEQSGYIYRRKLIDDKRKFIIGMTTPARDKFEQLSPQVERCYQQMRVDIGDDLVDEFTQVLDKVYNKLQQTKTTEKVKAKVI